MDRLARALVVRNLAIERQEDVRRRATAGRELHPDAPLFSRTRTRGWTRVSQCGGRDTGADRFTVRMLR